MFRGKSRCELTPEKFSIGSKVSDNRTEYLIVEEGNYIRLLDLTNFKLIKGEVAVEDLHFISEDELRSLISFLPYAFSDYTLHPIGLKKK